MDYNWDLETILKHSDYDKYILNFELILGRFEEQYKNIDYPVTKDSFLDLIHKYISLSEEINIIYARAYLAEEKNNSGEKEKLLKSKANNCLLKFQTATRPFIHFLKGMSVDGKIPLSEKELNEFLNYIPGLEFFFERLRKSNIHTLPINQEEIISNKDINGIQTLIDLRSLIDSDQKFKAKINGKLTTFNTSSDLAKYFKDPKRENRVNSYDSLYSNYKQNLPKYFTIYQSVAKDWTYESKLRKYPTNISIRNFANDIDDKTVQTLLDSCIKNKDVFNEFFKIKQKELGLKEMTRYDLYAPTINKEKKFKYEESESFVLKVLKGFDKEMLDLATKLFKQKHIDAFPAKGKRSGAFCANITNKIDPFLLLNHTDSTRDVFILAHELGHAMHYMISQEQSVLTQDAPLTLAETASTFTENIVFDHIYSQETDKNVKKSLLFDKITDAYATISRQAYFVLFELEAHKLLNEGVMIEDFNSVYLNNLRSQFGDYVIVPDVFKYEWSYIPHIVNSPFYCYAYPFGNLLAFSLYESYLEDGPKLIKSYKNILRAGGSEDPYKLLLKEGFDLNDPQFFNKGYKLINKWVEELKELV